MRHRIGQVWARSRVCVCIWSQSKHTIQKQTIEIEFGNLVAWRWKTFRSHSITSDTNLSQDTCISAQYQAVVSFCVWLHSKMNVPKCYRCPIQMYIHFLSTILVKPVQSRACVSVYCPLKFSKRRRIKKKHLNIYRLFMFINEMKWNL